MTPRSRTAPRWSPGPGALCIGIVAIALICGGFAPEGPARAQVAEETSGDSARRAPVGLDRLLELPNAHEYTVERRGGRTEGEWRQRFRELREALQQEREGLADAERRMQELAGETSAWKVAPALPGVSAPTDEAPLDYGLRRELQRHREEIQRLERKQRELEVEADLAGVPPAWRRGRGSGDEVSPPESPDALRRELPPGEPDGRRLPAPGRRGGP